ncbi:MAG TPA: hypothetical protein VKY92_15170 [Verrucomicrobiae bacterium]|nr:hypothetical protein [Verrucomicrobiae bacterium]
MRCHFDVASRASRVLWLSLWSFLTGACFCSQAATITWINTNGGNWSAATNWNPAQVPGASDSVVITNPGNYTVSVNANAQATDLVLGGPSGTQALTVSVATFSLTAGASIGTNAVFNLNSATLSGALLVSGTFNCTSSTVNAHSPVTILTAGTLNLAGSTSSSLYSAVTNFGMFNWTANGDVYLYNNASGGSTGSFVNQAGATFNVQNDRTISSQGNPYIINAGTFQKSAGSNSVINVAFTNAGVLNVSTGVVVLNGGGSLGGSISGQGTLNAASGTLGISTVVPSLLLSGATVVGQNAIISSLVWNGGTIQGTATFTGQALWNGGTIGTGGSVTVASNSVLNIKGTSGESVYGPLTNWGTINWASSTYMYLYNGFGGAAGAIYNQAGGLFDVQNDQSMSSGSGSPYFFNAGVFRKSAGSNTVLNLLFTNTGTMDLASGTVVLESGGSSTGTVSGTGSVNASSGTLVLAGFVPNLALSGATISSQGASISNLTWTGGSLKGSATLTAVGVWNGGTILSGGSLNIAPNAVLNINGNSSEALDGLLDNSGTVNWSSTSYIYAYNSTSGGSNGGIINEAGAVFNVESDQSLNSGSGSPFFFNAGTFEKTSGTNSTINLLFTNTGTMNLASGTVVLGSGGSIGGTISGAGTLNAAYGTLILSAAAANLLGSGATLNVQGAGISNLVMSSGTLQGSATLTGLGSWSGGNLAGGSTLTVSKNAVLNIGGNSSAYLYGLLANFGVINWSSNSDIVLYNSSSANWNGAIVNQPGAVFNILNDRSISSGSGNPFVSNAGTFQKSAGTNTTINVGFTNIGTIALGIYSQNSSGQFSLPYNATLSGSLQLSFNTYAPRAGDSFTLFTYNSENGVFSPVTIPTVGPWQTNLLNYGANSLRLTIGSSYSLGFSSVPAQTNAAGTVLPMVVQVQNSDGSPFATNGIPVTIGLTAGSGKLSGTVIQNTDASGKATFNDLSLNVVGQKTLTAAAASWISPVSTNVTVVPGQPAQLRLVRAITVSPQKSGYPIIPGAVVQVLDAPGNVVSNATTPVIANAFSSGGGSLIGGTSVSANGIDGSVAFTNLAFFLKDPNTAETVTVYFTSPGLSPTTNTAFTVDFVCGLIALVSGNSAVQIDPTTANGVYSWTVDGIEQMSQQWFWIQSGTNTTQVSIDQVATALGETITASSASFDYYTPGLIAKLSFLLQGGPPGSHASTLVESVSLQNTTNTASTIHFYGYTDFDLGGSTDGDTVSFPAANLALQQGKSMSATQTLGGPVPNFWEASWYALSLDSLQGPTHAVLSDKLNPPLAGDQTFAFQWDLAVPAGQSMILSFTNNIQSQLLQLNIAQSGASVLLYWPTNGSLNLKLQTTADPSSGGGWANVPSIPSISGSNYQVAMPITAGAQFFRLH